MTDDQKAERLGSEVSKALCLKRDDGDRIPTMRGSKTTQGLGYMILSMVEMLQAPGEPLDFTEDKKEED